MNNMQTANSMRRARVIPHPVACVSAQEPSLQVHLPAMTAYRAQVAPLRAAFPLAVAMQNRLSPRCDVQRWSARQCVA
jgi:hypothetical protein